MAWRRYGTNGKYNTKKVQYDGITFDSKKEYRRYLELKALEKAGIIKNLERQVKYVLIPAQREPDTVGSRGGIKKGKLIERECAYYADFVYIIKETGETVVEDVKGMRTPEYKIKRKLMLFVHHIKIKEI